MFDEEGPISPPEDEINEEARNDTSNKPKAYIRKVYHPRTGLPDEITDLNAPDPSRPIPALPTMVEFAPFASLTDFEFVEPLIKSCKSKFDINRELKNLRNEKVVEGPCKLQFTNADNVFKLVDQIANVYPGVSNISHNWLNFANCFSLLRKSLPFLILDQTIKLLILSIRSGFEIQWNGWRKWFATPHSKISGHGMHTGGTYTWMVKNLNKLLTIQ